MKARLFVVVEGSNGSGKSTVVDHLRRRLRARLFHFPPGFEAMRRELRLDTDVPAMPRLLYYLAGAVHLSELVQRELEAGRSVVCDRYLAAPLSLLVSEEALPEDQLSPLLAPVLGSLVRPQLTLLMVADHTVASERVQRRAERESRPLTPVEERSVSSPAFFARREAELRRRSAELGPVAEIDTTDMTSEEAVTACDRAVAELTRSDNARVTG